MLSSTSSPPPSEVAVGAVGWEGDVLFTERRKNKTLEKKNPNRRGQKDPATSSAQVVVFVEVVFIVVVVVVLW